MNKLGIVLVLVAVLGVGTFFIFVRYNHTEGNDYYRTNTAAEEGVLDLSHRGTYTRAALNDEGLAAGELALPINIPVPEHATLEALFETDGGVLRALYSSLDREAYDRYVELLQVTEWFLIEEAYAHDADSDTAEADGLALTARKGEVLMQLLYYGDGNGALIVLKNG